MKIAIIGTNGFLSTSIAKYAIGKGWSLDMYGLDKPIQHPYTYFYPIDLMYGDIEVDKLSMADIIVYAVGAGIQSNLNEGANLIYTLNVNAPVRICNALKQAGYKGIFVTFGSYFELGEAELEHPVTEEYVINATASAPTDYVVSKRMLTRFVTSYKHEFVHWHFILPTIYGPGENPQRLIPYTISAIKNRSELHFTSGKQVRQYLFVDDIANILSLSYSAALPSGIYNIASSNTLCVQAIVSLIFASFNKTLPKNCFGEVERIDERMRYLSIDGAKLKSIIHYESHTRIKDIINLYCI